MANAQNGLMMAIRRVVPKLLTGTTLALALAVPQAFGAADAIWHEARFSSIDVQGEGCDGVFAVDTYEAQHFLVGPTGRTSVIHLRDRSGAPVQDLGFFDGISFIGQYGSNGDVFINRDISKGGIVYKAHLEGLVDRRVIFVQIQVTRMEGERILCAAQADFAGFN